MYTGGGGGLSRRRISASYRGRYRARIRITHVFLAVVVYTRSAHRAFAHTWREIRPEGEGGRLAHVSANLIYFGPDKKLIYRAAREVRPGSLGKRRFLLRPTSREPEVTRCRCCGPGHDEIPLCDEVERKKKKEVGRGRKRSRRK